MTIEVHPVDGARWPDLTVLFGPNGAYSGCWCMFWRLPNAELNGSSADERRGALQALAEDEQVGLLAYVDGEPAGWCAVAPRTEYRRLPRTKEIAPQLGPDNPGIWSVTCFYIRRDRRRGGVASALLDAALTYAGEAGATVVEAYPAAAGTTATARLSTGTVDLFARAGFEPIDAGARRAVMRRAIT